jgi:hypothetical protein
MPFELTRAASRCCRVKVNGTPATVVGTTAGSGKKPSQSLIRKRQSSSFPPGSKCDTSKPEQLQSPPLFEISGHGTVANWPINPSIRLPLDHKLQNVHLQQARQEEAPPFDCQFRRWHIHCRLPFPSGDDCMFPNFQSPPALLEDNI